MIVIYKHFHFVLKFQYLKDCTCIWIFICAHGNFLFKMYNIIKINVHCLCINKIILQNENILFLLKDCLCFWSWQSVQGVPKKLCSEGIMAAEDTILLNFHNQVVIGSLFVSIIYRYKFVRSRSHSFSFGYNHCFDHKSKLL